MKPSQPRPAVVTQRAAERLPRLALLILCAVYVLPGVIGRDPWRNADLTAFGYMSGLADGRMSWWAPSLGGMAPESAVLPHWLGALFILGFHGWMDAALAARLPFALLLGLTLMLVWYTAYHLARAEAAQPVAFAFGGEAAPIDYARALADGAVLGMMATLGLLQLGHETTPELMQLFGCSLFLWSQSFGAKSPRWASVATLLALPLLALSGAPVLAGFLGLSSIALGGLVMARRTPTLALALALATLASVGVLFWRWPHVAWAAGAPFREGNLPGFLRLLLWFSWPCLPLAGWTVWQWRRQWRAPHISGPLSLALGSIAASALLGSSDRAMLMATPGLAILAAFALPTLKRNATSAIDWFSVFFFSVAALVVWVIYASMHWGVPKQPLVNILRLVPGFVPEYSSISLLFAALGTVAWLWLVRWRTARHRHALWKSLVLPASGVAVVWLLTMTLLLPVLDHGRSTRPLVNQIALWIPRQSCILTVGVPRTHVAGLEVFGAYKVASEGVAAPNCPFLLRMDRLPQVATLPGWKALTTLRRPVDRHEYFTLYERAPEFRPSTQESPAQPSASPATPEARW
jgi:hypothetical protein